MDISSLLFIFPLLVLVFLFFYYYSACIPLFIFLMTSQEAISVAGFKAFLTHCQTLPRNVTSLPPAVYKCVPSPRARQGLTPRS